MDELLSNKKGRVRVFSQAPPCTLRRKKSPPVGRWAFLKKQTGSERQAHLTLEQTSATLAGHLTKRRTAVDAERCALGCEVWRWMVQDILRIEPHRQALGLRNLESLAQVGIEAPAAQTDNSRV